MRSSREAEAPARVGEAAGYSALPCLLAIRREIIRTMEMLDYYEPTPAIDCPACSEPLSGWQGKDGACALVVWRQGADRPGCPENRRNKVIRQGRGMNDCEWMVGGQTTNHLWLTVQRRLSDSPDHWFDYGSLRCRIRVRAGGMCADIEGTLRAEAIKALAQDLEDLDRAFAPGVVSFEPKYEAPLRFTVAVAAVGPISISGEAIDGLGTGTTQRLTFGFTVEDSLQAIATSVGAVARAFPPSPRTELTRGPHP